MNQNLKELQRVVISIKEENELIWNSKIAQGDDKGADRCNVDSIYIEEYLEKFSEYSDFYYSSYVINRTKMNLYLIVNKQSQNEENTMSRLRIDRILLNKIKLFNTPFSPIAYALLFILEK